MNRRSDGAESARADGAAEVPWRDLIGAVGADIAGPLTDALEQVHSMLASGKIDQQDLRALRASIEQARQVAISAQQLTRFASRRIRLSHERVQLDAMLADVLRHRAREADAAGLALQSPAQYKLQAAEVLADATLLFCLLNTLFDWALRHADSALQFGIDIKTWPAHARLRCAFNVAAVAAGSSAPSAVYDSLTWRLLEQIASAMDLLVTPTLSQQQVELLLEFPRTANHSMEGVSSVDLSDDSTDSPNSMPLVGSHVLIIASRRDVRVQIRDAIHHMGLVIDLVSSVEEAVEFCREGLPHAIIVEGILDGERLAALRSELWAEVPDLAFVDITEEGQDFEMSDAGTGQVARVGRAAVETALPSVLLFELSKGL